MSYKMLLADDSITIQKVVTIIFANEDYELTIVDNGSAALDRAREIVPDIILVDALMPGMTGYEVCSEARHDPLLRDIPLLLLVGAFEPFDEGKARESGADDYISKPFESQHLIDKVRNLIELATERRSVHEHFAMSATGSMPENLIILPEEVEVPTITGTRTFITPSEISGSAATNSSEPLLLSSKDIVEATPEDDLWGIFDLEEFTEGEDLRFGEIIEEDEIEPEIIDTAEEIEPFVFEEEEEQSTIIDDVRTDFVAEPARERPSVRDLESEFEEKETFSPNQIEELDSSDSFLQSDKDFTRLSSQDFHSGEEPSGVTLSEAQLATVIAKISKEIIEKIAWDVVPDLAESIIREEIRKIRQG